jgi:steroid 5-alpha reductase family enzyme
MLAILIGVTATITTFASTLFVLSLHFKRNDIADVAWGPGIALASWSAWYLSGQPTTLTTLVLLGLVTVWATRLGIRIYRKNKRKGEDARYARWRAAWGRNFYIRSFFQVYLLQGALMIVVAYGAIHASIHATIISESMFLLIAGSTLWVIGFIFESVGDYQLDAFLKNPASKGRLMRYGLWHYSRHPNYFGEVTMWWAIWLIVLPLPLSAIALISPLTITGLILFVSGIPLLEAGLAKHPEFATYKQTTSVFFPWWPKSNK